MHDLYVKDILNLGGKLISGSEDVCLTNFCTDSRVVKEKDTFVCLKGEVFDGNDYLKEVIDKGASVVIASKLLPNIDYRSSTVVLVEDTLDILQKLAMLKREKYDIPVIAITGSVGKTSTKDIVYSVVKRKYNTCRTIGNYNNHIGVPLTILSLTDEEALVIEMGMNHLGEISLLSKIAKPTIAIITNVGTAHIGNLGSRENILKAKLEILDGMIGNTLILNLDNDMLKLAYDKYKDNYNIYTFSIKDESDYKASNISYDIMASKFDIESKTKDIAINVGGIAGIYNSLAAYIVGDILKISDKEIKKGIFEFKLSSGRLEKKISKRGVTIIDDSYNANFDSMKSSLELLGKVQDKRKIAILGDMLELGEYSQNLHQDLGKVVKDNNIDILITIGKEAKAIAEVATKYGFSKDNIYSYNKEEEINNDLLEKFTNEDIILVKASHGMNLKNVVNRLMEIE